jgi:hypothetical protein
MVLAQLDFHIQIMNFHLYLTLYTKIGLNWVVNLNIKFWNYKMSRKNIENLCDLGWGKDFSEI